MLNRLAVAGTRASGLWLAALVALLALPCLVPTRAAAATDTGVATANGPRAPGGAGQAQSADGDRLVPLGPGDSITIQVFGQPDMTSTVYVADDGTVHVPLAGSVAVGGATSVQAAQRIAQALKSGGYFVDPVVSVSLVQTRNDRVSVLGEVHQPGTYPIDPSTTVFDLLALAGGETANGADVVYVRRHEPGGQVASFPVDLQSLGGAGGTAAVGAENQAANRRLQAGDELYVPQAEHFYIYGEVTAPNLYKLEPGMTVIQAIARAGGITPRGSSRRIDVKRQGKNGHYVISHATADELVQPDDVIRVKESLF
ncbi:MAG TPA: SLBB domain-containing protein [Steroidobacteraceae bacterium]|jgi:polysaccharide export outer membrane protein|nr:SLBB domain-containing protein [Steroidobacteraceae bacterium]